MAQPVVVALLCAVCFSASCSREDGNRVPTTLAEAHRKHPDDMSGIILDTFWCKLHHQPFRFDERAKYYQEYWRSMEKPKGGSPADGARIAWVVTQGSGTGTAHLGISTSDHSNWRYEYRAFSVTLCLGGHFCCFLSAAMASSAPTSCRRRSSRLARSLATTSAGARETKFSFASLPSFA